MPLPCSPVSSSMGEDTSGSQSQSAVDSDSEGDLITPKPGPAAPEQRNQSSLSKPFAPSPAAFKRSTSFKDWSTNNAFERPETSTESEAEQTVEARGSVSSINSKAGSDNKQSPYSPDSREGPTVPVFQLSVVSTVASTPPSLQPSSPSSSNKSVVRARSRSGSSSSSKKGVRQAKYRTKSSTSVPITKIESERSRSVSFHPSSYNRGNLMDDQGLSPGTSAFGSQYMAKRASPRGSLYDAPHLHEEPESSADENTAILRRNSAAKTGVGTYGTSKLKQDDHGLHAEGYEGAAEEERGSSDKAVDRLRKVSRAGNAADSGQSEAANRSQRDDNNSHDDEPDSWWKRLAEKYGSIELENKGSVARDHLALERTFLAWLRTSLSFASIGIAVTQLFRLNTALQSQQKRENFTPVMVSSGSASIDHTFGSQQGPIYTSDLLLALASPELRRLGKVGKPLGATFLAVAILILFVGFHRYFESQHYIRHGKFPASRGSIVLVSFVAGALIVTSLVVIITFAPAPLQTSSI